ncbi:hypothetical protein [Lysobacter sp. 1R34A]|uniref:hypothetical protein n=1 Tax=Lysobacter sp. 1R34A TaxID=3445786 RepID=UPI003EEBEEA8
MLRPDTRREPNRLRSVRLRSAERDTLRARQSLERALAAVDWSLSELPPNALLLVRRLRAGPHATAAFGAQVSQALREQQRKAKRPWRDDGAATAEAVWFDDGELAACLVRDWLRGHVSQRWWWRTVLGRAAVDEWLREQVLDDGRQVATTLSLLAPGGDAAAWLSRLHDGDARRGLNALARDYQAPLALLSGHAFQTADPGDGIDAAAPDSQQALPPAPATAAAPPDHRARPAACASRRDAARLLAAMPELRNEALRPTTVRLLAFALAATREPGWLRSADFADAVTAWTQSRSAAAPKKPRPAPPGAAPLAHPQRSRPTRPAAAIVLDTALVSSVEAIAATTAAKPQIGLEPSAASPPGPSLPPEVAPAAKRSKRSPTAAPHGRRSRVRATGDAAATAHTTAAASDARGTETPTEIPAFDTATATDAEPADTTPQPIFNLGDGVRIDSDYGGLPYLLNAALVLELYGDFTMPRARGLALSPWNWLALVGEAWFGASLRRDPLWRLLADLAGRKPQQAPAHDFVAPRDWAIDAAWLQPWDEVDALGYRAGPRRLRLWHPQGFVLADLPRSPASAPSAQAAAWCAQRAGLSPARLVRLARAPAPSPRQRNRRWLHYLLAYLEARLARALGVDTAEVPALVCRHRAQLHCNLVDVEVRLSLEALPLSLRLAGLDRDPGWIPAAGRSVRFRFA